MANEQYLAFDPELHPDLADIYDRSKTSGSRDRAWFRERAFVQGADINEGFSIERQGRQRVGDMVASDGDRVSGAEAIVDQENESVTLSAGTVYILGDVRPVDAAVLEDVSMEGDVKIGVRVVSELITSDEDASLLGLHAGSAAQGEPGAIREVKSLIWGFDGDGGEGDLYQVYLLADGYIVDQAPPPALTGFTNALARYDYDAHENYIARGCEVTALGSDGDGGQVFSIGLGVADILGFKRTRTVDTRFVQEEEPDIATVILEQHVFADGGAGSVEIPLRFAPINGITQIAITKQFTETLVRGGVANTSDLLSKSSVTEIVSVVQSPTTFTETTDYALDGNHISWAPGGSEPTGGSSYDITYFYTEVVAADAIGASSITVSGGVTGEAVWVSYTWKLPRWDRICFNKDGGVEYIKGSPAVEQPRAPKTPETLLSLCVVKNDWFGTPEIDNDGTRAISFTTQWKYQRRLIELLDLVSLERLRRDIDSREPVAKHGIFVDPLVSERYRDAGEDQDMAVFNGTGQIAIDPTFQSINRDAPLFLDFQEALIIRQDLVTGCMKVNPYQNFTPPALVLSLTPAVDFFTETDDAWTSAVTQVFGVGNTSRVTDVDVVVTTETVAARFLRQIDVAFRLEGFGEGETLDELYFDSRDVTPVDPLAGDESGVIEGSFTIPDKVSSGTKLVHAVGSSGRTAAARYTGTGVIERIRRQVVTSVTRVQVDPPTRVIDVTPPPETGIIDTGVGRVGDFDGHGSPDPLAQSFAVGVAQHITAVSVKICAIGDRTKPVICEIVEMDNGFPTTRVVAQTEIDMGPVIANVWTRFEFRAPVFIPTGQQFAFVFKTDDPDHSLAIAKRGGYDTANQKYVGAQPYTVGVLFSSSNAISWTPHQDIDLAFRVHAARFNPLTKIVNLGVVAVVNLSDMIVDATSFLPTGNARVLFELQADGEDPVRVEPGQVWERQSFFTGNVTIRAILTGSILVTPVLGRDFLVVKGAMRASGTYVSRAFDIGSDVRADVVLKGRLPAGSTLEVSLDGADDDFSALPQTFATALADGTYEYTFSDDEFDNAQGRVKIVLTGTPAARPAIYDLRAFTI